MRKSGKAIRPLPMPVVAVRVPASLHRRIIQAAKRSGRTMSDEMAHLLALGFEMQDTFGERRQIIAEANAQAKQIRRGALETRLRRENWRPVHGTPYWWGPEAHGLPPEFVEAPQADQTTPETATKRAS
jgi:hypothetical protein